MSQYQAQFGIFNGALSREIKYMYAPTLITRGCRSSNRNAVEFSEQYFRPHWLGTMTDGLWHLRNPVKRRPESIRIIKSNNKVSGFYNPEYWYESNSLVTPYGLLLFFVASVYKWGSMHRRCRCGGARFIPGKFLRWFMCCVCSNSYPFPRNTA